MNAARPGTPKSPAENEQDRWIALVASSFATASHWLGALSLGLTMLAASRLVLFREGGAAAALLVALVVAGAMVLYFAVRIEIDRTIFAALAGSSTDLPAAAARLDQAMHALSIAVPPGRDMTNRASGLLALLRRQAALLVTQVLLVAALLWLPVP